MMTELRSPKTIKVYANRTHYKPGDQDNLSPIVRAIWSDTSSREEVTTFRSRKETFVSVARPEEADVHVLCLNWNSYLERGEVSLVAKDASQARRANRPLLVFSQGDFTADIPISGVTLFQCSAYRSRQRLNGNRTFALPSFIADYQDIYCQGSAKRKSKQSRPIVGFCGQADDSFLDSGRRWLACQGRKLAFWAGLRKWEPAPFETVRWRKHVLDVVASEPRIETRFILRRRYRAGYRAKRKDPLHSTRLEMVENMLDTNYTVCMRGGGNFSVRLYETLCLGRIPVFVDTDCVLPYDHVVNWRDYCVWVDSADVSKISNRVCEFHGQLSDDAFIARQQQCREFWLNWLSMDGFWRQFWRYLPVVHRA